MSFPRLTSDVPRGTPHVSEKARAIVRDLESPGADGTKQTMAEVAKTHGVSRLYVSRCVQAALEAERDMRNLGRVVG